MNNVASPFNVVTQDAPLAHRELLSLNSRLTGANPVLSEEIIHELRQPLGVIDSLAYYLELTSADENSCRHLEKIRAMVSQVNGILERASGTHRELPIGNSYLADS